MKSIYKKFKNMYDEQLDSIYKKKTKSKIVEKISKLDIASQT